MKAYQLVGIEVAMQLIRPGARWEISNRQFTIWDDPRPCPTWEEVMDVVEKLKAFEDSITPVLLPEQQAEIERRLKLIEAA
jgi:hypothetical protein